MFEREFKASASAYEFQIKDAKFTVHGFRLTSPRVTKHRLTYSADQRAVLSDNLEKHIPNLNGRLIDADGHSFVYLAVVQSPYLTDRVNSARTDFEIGRNGRGGSFDQPNLLVE